jgi:hypothetical protein
MSKYQFVYVTSESDYSKFSKFPENRTPKPTHSSKIAKSIELLDLIGANPIIVSNGKIIDGQHRILACEMLGIPYSYIEIKGMSDKEAHKAMQTLNSNAKNWGLLDYLKHYCELGNPNYITLNQFMDTHDLSISVCIYMMRGFNDLAYKNASEESGFKDGFFQFVDLDKANRIAIYYNQIRNIIPDNNKILQKAVKSIGFIKAVLKIATQQEDIYDQNHMYSAFMSDVKSKTPKFRKFESVEEYYDILVKIYNSKNPDLFLATYWDLNSTKILSEVEEE